MEIVPIVDSRGRLYDTTNPSASSSSPKHAGPPRQKRNEKVKSRRRPFSCTISIFFIDVHIFAFIHYHSRLIHTMKLGPEFATLKMTISFSFEILLCKNVWERENRWTCRWPGGSWVIKSLRFVSAKLDFVYPGLVAGLS